MSQRILSKDGVVADYSKQQPNTIPYDQMRAALFRANAQCLATWDGPVSKRNKGSARSCWSEMELWALGANETSRLVILQRWIDSGGFDAYIQITEHKTDKAIEEVIGCTKVDSRVKTAFIADPAALSKEEILMLRESSPEMVLLTRTRSDEDMTLLQRAEAYLSGAFEGEGPREGWPGLLADLRKAIGINTPPLKDKPAAPGSYAALHDGLSDMIEGGRLRAEHIPDDYQWLVESLAKLANTDIKPAWYDNILTLFAESLNSWQGEEESVKEEHADLIDRMQKALDQATAGKTLPTPEPLKPAIVITISGGNYQGAMANMDIDLGVYDTDNLEEESEAEREAIFSQMTKGMHAID